MVGTLENVRLQTGDRVVVLLGSGEYQADVVNANDSARLKVELDTGSEVWVGRWLL